MLSFTQACHKYFSPKKNQKLFEFQAEIKALTEADRNELAPLLSVELGEPVTPDLYIKAA